MNTSIHNPPEWPPRTAAERDRLRERAIEQAHALRREAIADFYRGAVDLTRRAADRLAARLRQHHKQRGEASGSGRAVEA